MRRTDEYVQPIRIRILGTISGIHDMRYIRLAVVIKSCELPIDRSPELFSSDM
jgi:hypothetical protein